MGQIVRLSWPLSTPVRSGTVALYIQCDVDVRSCDAAGLVRRHLPSFVAIPFPSRTQDVFPNSSLPLLTLTRILHCVRLRFAYPQTPMPA